MTVGPDTEVHDVDATELAEPQLVGVGTLVAPHGVVGVDRPHPLEQRLSHQPVVGALVVERDAALVAPVDVDLPPVDLVAGVVGQALVAAARRLAPGNGEREPVVGPAVERLDDPLGELAGHVVDHYQLTLHVPSPHRGAGQDDPLRRSSALVSSAAISSSKLFANEATPWSSSAWLTSSRSTPASPIAASVSAAAWGSASTVRASVPWSSTASSVASGPGRLGRLAPATGALGTCRGSAHRRAAPARPRPCRATRAPARSRWPRAAGRPRCRRGSRRTTPRSQSARDRRRRPRGRRRRPPSPGRSGRARRSA